MKAQHNFRGVFPYLVSPVDENGQVLENVLRDLVEYLIESGVHGLSPLGSTGEVVYLDWEQRRRICEIVIDQADGRVPVVAGIAAHSIRDAVRQAKELEKLGVDGLIPFLLTYFPLSPGQIGDFFRAVAQSVEIPICLYSNPRFQGFELTVDLVAELAEEPNIAYLKDASGRTGLLLSITRRVGEKIRVFSASAHLPVSVMQIGGVGWMAGPACIVPRQCVRLYELAEAKRWEEALELQSRLWTLNSAFQRFNLAACIKAGLQIIGFPVGDPIPPQAPLSQSQMEELRELVLGLREGERA